MMPDEKDDRSAVFVTTPPATQTRKSLTNRVIVTAGPGNSDYPGVVNYFLIRSSDRIACITMRLSLQI